MLNITLNKTPFQAPRLFFTTQGNERSQGVLSVLGSMIEGEAAVRVFADGAEVQRYFEGGVSPNAAVVLADTSLGQHFSPTTFRDWR